MSDENRGLLDDTAGDPEHSTVSGAKVHRSDFAYVGDAKDKSTWKLPIHDEAHVRNALARFNLAEIPAGKKKEVASKLVSAAKKHKIDTSAFEEKYMSERLADLTLEPIRDFILRKFTPPPLGEPGTAVPWIVDVFDQYVIVSDGEKLYRVPYTITRLNPSKQDVSLGQAQEVRETSCLEGPAAQRAAKYVPASEVAMPRYLRAIRLDALPIPLNRDDGRHFMEIPIA